MDSYIDIRLIPDAELPINRLLSALYTKLHKALCDLKSESIGVSFPAYNVMLGNVLRLHSTEADLDKLEAFDWLCGLRGYCEISTIKLVPAEVKFRVVSRKQTTMSKSKLKRLLKRGSITEEETKGYKAKLFIKGIDNPSVELVSGSNGQIHRRYIGFSPLLDKPISGNFDQFGLSKTATVPWFD
jgi:CRISPR-associated endonuclease Csy4